MSSDNTVNSADKDMRGALVTAEAAEKVAHVLGVAIEFLDEVQKFLGEQKPKAVRLRMGNKVIARLPVTLTTLGALGVGLVAVLITKLAMDIEREN